MVSITSGNSFLTTLKFNSLSFNKSTLISTSWKNILCSNKSILHLYFFKLSSPNINPTLTLSRTLIDISIKTSFIYIGARRILPSILDSPTPLAIPENLSSMRLLNPKDSAILTSMIVICAPVSTNTWVTDVLILASNYNILMCSNTSGIFSWAYLRLSSFRDCCISS